ncbi:2OG-Fe(II) oxygenase [bacterium]|nr:2OG-Fe(II) oxygenase [bacterium]
MENIDVFLWYLDLPKSNENWAFSNKIFTNEELDRIIEIGLDTTYSKHEKARVGGDTVGDTKGAVDTKLRRGDISWIKSSYIENQWVFKKLTDTVNVINDTFFNYDLKYIENLQFTMYNGENKDFYSKHIDMGYQTVNTRKLSFSLQLSDPNDYKGGDLVLHYQEKPIVLPKERGTCLFFPSYTLHQVTPVTKGTRYSLVGWVMGPRFK